MAGWLNAGGASMFDQWGSVPGDANATAIIQDRRSGKASADIGLIIVGLLLLGAAVWYGVSGEPAALAVLIVSAVWTINGTVTGGIYPTHTFVMIAERRVQLLEQQVQEMRATLLDLRHQLDRR